MQLTNYSAIDLRHGTAKVLDDRDHSIRRITTGKRMVRASDDPGAIAVASNLDVTNRQRAALRTNLQNTRTYLDAQADALTKAHRTYERMGVVATQSLDVVLSDNDRAALDVEFQELAGELSRLLSEKFNGVDLFNQNVKCGGVQDLQLGALDYTTKNKGPDGLKRTDVTPNDPSLDNDNPVAALRATTEDVHATGGTLTFSVNSGGAGEIYRVFMGGQEVFSTGPSFAGSDLSDEIIYGYSSSYTGPKPNNDVSNVLQSSISNPNSWRTSGSAGDGDKDTFKITFGPGIPTTYEVAYGFSNSTDPSGTPPDPQADYFDYDTYGQGDLKSAGGNGVIRISDLPAGATGTDLTVQFETRSIGIISDVKFEPQSSDVEVTISENGDSMSISAKGFSTMSGFDVKTAANAQAALAKLAIEDDCVVSERMGALRAEVARVDQRLDELAGSLVQGEAAYGRVADLDYAKEMTTFATNSMQLNVMTSSMATANRATDVLMPLTTEQFNSAVTRRFQFI